MSLSLTKEGLLLVEEISFKFSKNNCLNKTKLFQSVNPYLKALTTIDYQELKQYITDNFKEFKDGVDSLANTLQMKYPSNQRILLENLFILLKKHIKPSAFESLKQKIDRLKQLNRKGDISYESFIQNYPSKKCNFQDLLDYIGSFSIEFSDEESTLLAQTLSSSPHKNYNQMQIRAQDFLSLISNNNENQYSNLDEHANIGVEMANSKFRGSFYETLDGISLQGYDDFVIKFENAAINDQEFIDGQFPPSENSLNSNKNHPKYDEMRNLDWYRPRGIFHKNNYSMFDNNYSSESRIGLEKLIHPNDIQQGTLGDCYFLSSLSCLAQEPHRIRNLFLTRQINQFGIYCIRICWDGQWEAITLDDHIPCKQGHNGPTPAFTKASGNAIWVVLLEKAWAKIYGSYEKIELGHCEEALRDLSGAPTQNIYTFEKVDVNGISINQINQNLLPILEGALDENNKYLVTAVNSSDDLSAKQAEQLGLITSHAYSVLGIFKVNHPDHGNIVLLKLRNPWGNQEWKGDWSTSSKLWTQNLKEQLKVKEKREGIFFMSLDDFYQYFLMITICYINDSYKYTSLRVFQSDRKHSTHIILQIQQKGNYYISVVQPNKRNFQKDLKYKYSLGRLFIGQIQNELQQQSIRFIGSIQKVGRETFIQAHFDEGIYMIEAKIKWEQSYSTSFVVSTYGVAMTQMTIIDKTSIGFNFRDECFKQLARKKVKVGEMRLYEINRNQGFGFYYYQNQQKIPRNLEVWFSKMEGFKLQKPFRGTYFQNKINPESEFIAIFKVDHINKIEMQINEKF